MNGWPTIRDVKTSAASVVAMTWSQPEPRDSRRNPLSARGRRAAIAAAVVALHVVVMAFVALRPVTTDLAVRAGAPLLVTFVEPTAVQVEELSVPSDALELAQPEVEIEQPQLAADAKETLKDAATRPMQDFLPPRLDETSAMEPVELARLAGLPNGRSARVILGLTVTNRGTASDIQVTLSSGDARIDAVAVEYARALRWAPAVVQGQNSNMNIRLPVVFVAPV
jgi:TonB family protein